MPSAHDFAAKALTGEGKKLSDYAGRVLLVVNFASSPRPSGADPMGAEIVAAIEKALAAP